MSLEINLEEKRIARPDLSQRLTLSYTSAFDFKFADEVANSFKDSDYKNQVKQHLQKRARQIQSGSEIILGDINLTSDFSITDKEEFDRAQETLAVVEGYRGDYISALEEVANLKNELLKAQTFSVLAAKIDSRGFDATPVFHLAIESIDNFMRDESFDSLSQLEGIEIMEQFLKDAIHLGYFNVVRFAAETGKNGKAGIEVLLSLVKSLIDSATIQATKGLSDTEIKALSQADIDALLGGSDEETKKAIEYFGLGK